MKHSFLRKFKAFPYAVVQKQALQQWNPLMKLSSERKRFYKKKSLFFSIEYGRSLNKRILWQVATPAFINSPFVPAQNVAKDLKIQGRRFLNLKGIQANKPNHVYKMKSLKPSSSFQYSWSLFRSLFFGKIWILNNPSLVPGVLWLTKSKKAQVAKMRAFAAVSDFVGKVNRRTLLQKMHKLWVGPLCFQTKPRIWSLVSGFDSLKSTVLLKSGFVPTTLIGSSFLLSEKASLNGFVPQKHAGYVYPGDFFSVHPVNGLLSLSKTLGQIFSYGPGKKVSVFEKAYWYSIYTMKPFIWLAGFYTYGKSRCYKKKKSIKKYKKGGFIQKIS